MSPTLLAGDYIIASLRIPGKRFMVKDTIRSEHYIVIRENGKRSVCVGDVVVFNFPYSKEKRRMAMNPDLYFCKRCVATPGMTYNWKRSKGIDSVYLPRRGEAVVVNSVNIQHYGRCIEYETGYLPRLYNGEIVIHADTVMHSYSFKSNYYFVRGDNFADSYDSRFWGILPEDFILGVGLFTWFSRDKDKGCIRWERMFKKLNTIIF